MPDDRGILHTGSDEGRRRATFTDRISYSHGHGCDYTRCYNHTLCTVEERALSRVATPTPVLVCVELCEYALASYEMSNDMSPNLMFDLSREAQQPRRNIPL